MQVFVKTPVGKILPLNLDGANTIGQMKEQIKTLQGIDPSLQKLVYAGTLLVDSQTLDFYSISNGAMITLTIGLKEEYVVFIKMMTGKIDALYVTSQMKVGDLKEMIHTKKQLPGSEIRLLFGTTALTDERTMAECNVVEKSILYCVLILSGGHLSIVS